MRRAARLPKPEPRAKFEPTARDIKTSRMQIIKDYGLFFDSAAGHLMKGWQVRLESGEVVSVILGDEDSGNAVWHARGARALTREEAGRVLALLGHRRCRITQHSVFTAGGVAYTSFWARYNWVSFV